MSHGFKIVLATLLICGCTAQPELSNSSFSPSVVGTNDVHGVLLRDDKRGGLTTLSGYVNALKTTIAANVGGLRVLPLAAAIRREALALRSAGATVVIVTAHAGGQCFVRRSLQDIPV